MQRLNPIPDHLICSLSLDIFLEPVSVVPSGHVYEKEMIEKHIATATQSNKPALCPKSRTPIRELIPAWGMIAAVNDHLVLHPEDKEHQYTKENSQPSAAVVEQIRNDEIIAREMTAQETRESGDGMAEWLAQQRRDTEQREAAALALRQKQDAIIRRELDAEVAAWYQARQPQPAVIAQPPQPNQEINVTLDGQDQLKREALLADIQNLIYALKFEVGPESYFSMQNLFFSSTPPAPVEPLPWKKIVVANGPRSDGMHNVLLSAMRALKELNPDDLSAAKERNNNHYDLVKPLLGGQISLSKNGYATFAKAMGTIKNQPGYLVDQILLRVDHMMHNLCAKYPAKVQHHAQPRMGR